MFSTFTAPDGARIACSDQGAGTPILCLAGLTRTMADFDYFAPHLPQVRLIRMDYRGRGASSWTGAASYTVLQEAKDALELLDHLGIVKAAILGTSRGGLIGLVLCALAKDRISGLFLNDIGPKIDPAGLARIGDYVGRNPAARSLDEMAMLLPEMMPGFANLPEGRWRAEAEKHYLETDSGLIINYDPALRSAFETALKAPSFDGWPLFDALYGLPIALIRGVNSDLLSAETASEMRRRRPDMIFAEVPGRAHIPFLDEPESLIALQAFVRALS